MLCTRRMYSASGVPAILAKQRYPLRTQMQLSNIRIEKLFGRFDYSIALNRQEKITIIHAPNGYGKTALLTLANAFFSSQFSLFFKYQFHSMVLEFVDNTSIEILKLSDPDLFNPKTPQQIQIRLLPTPVTQAPYVLNSSEGIPALNRILAFLSPPELMRGSMKIQTWFCQPPKQYRVIRNTFQLNSGRNLRSPNGYRKLRVRRSAD